MSFLSFLFLLFPSILAEWISGTLTSPNGWEYAGKFVFDWDHVYKNPDGTELGFTQGLANFNISVDQSNIYKDLFLYAYDDEYMSWPSIYEKGLTCEEKTEPSRYRYAFPISFDENGTHSIELPIVEKIKPRFWYFVISNCKNFENVHYMAHLVNLNNVKLNKEFSVNEQDFFTLYLFLLLIYIPFFIIQYSAYRKLSHAQSFHHIVVIFTITVGCQTCAIIFNFLHYTFFIDNGVGVWPLHWIAEILRILAQLLFFLIIIQLAYGLTISTPQIKAKKLVIIIISLLIVSYITMYIWHKVGVDRASNLYIYESIPGLFILLLHLFFCVWFAFTTFTTHREEVSSDKRLFYVIFGWVYSLWIISLPLIVCAAALLDPWIREKTVEGLSLSSNTFAYLLLSFLLMPTKITEQPMDTAVNN